MLCDILHRRRRLFWRQARQTESLCRHPNPLSILHWQNPTESLGPKCHVLNLVVVGNASLAVFEVEKPKEEELMAVSVLSAFWMTQAGEPV